MQTVLGILIASSQRQRSLHFWSPIACCRRCVSVGPHRTPRVVNPQFAASQPIGFPASRAQPRSHSCVGKWHT